MSERRGIKEENGKKMLEGWKKSHTSLLFEKKKNGNSEHD